MPNGVRILIVDTDERLLVSIRSQTAKYYPNTIQVPGGGVDDGEDPLDAAVRETFEETGIILDRESLIHLGSYPGQKNGEGETYIRHSYLYRWPDVNDPQAELREPDKNTEWSMMSIKYLDGSTTPGLLPGLVDALNSYRAMRQKAIKKST